jgi:RNA polymerase sigma factor (sigma-70 family)
MTSAANAESQARKKTLLDTLYRQYHRALTRFVNRQRLGPEAAAEIVQETYARMHHVSNVESLEHPRAYLYRTALNLARDHHRQSQARQAREHVDIEGVELASEEPSAYRILNGQQELTLVRQALLELSPKCRRAFILNRFEGVTYQGIAAELDVSVSMIEKYISQALAHLKMRVNTARLNAPQPRTLKQPR